MPSEGGAAATELSALSLMRTAAFESSVESTSSVAPLFLIVNRIALLSQGEAVLLLNKLLQFGSSTG
jgi:hypothetical protein